ncbi:MAG: RNase A-like domain-containing protein [Jatrophihabitantaceae bacterium]
MSTTALDLIVRPLPLADEPMVRAGAARYAALAAELRRIRLLLIGALNSDVGWSGSARLAFDETVHAQAAGMDPLAARYEGYAAALNGYATALASIRPRLLSARAELVGGLGTPTGGVAVSVGEFERWWGEWEVARGRCVAGLVAAAGVGGDRRGGGWSGLLHGVAGVVPHPGLAGLSRALGELGQALVVAGVVLALVCPPAAGVVWAAVAVVAVCQLAVDVARRGRGERVGAGRLGWDVLAVLPVGRVAAGAHSAVAASAAIERLAPGLRSSRLVPGGGLVGHEGSATLRGHTLLKHVGRSPQQLAQRFQTEPKLIWSSSFTDRATAEAAVAKALDDNRQEVAEWLISPLGKLPVVTDVGMDIGKSVAKDGSIISTSKVRVILRKEDSVLGYYVKSAYPSP